MSDDENRDFRARLRHAWTEENGAPTWVEEILIDAYADHLDAALGRIIGDTENCQPLGFLGVGEPVVETEEQRVKRELVPLVRAAADEVPLPGRAEVLGGHLRGHRCVDDALDTHRAEQQWSGFLDRWDLTPDLTCRRHARELPCWCDAFLLGGVVVHQDDRIPPWSSGYAISNDLLKDWPA
jgi:hypothetical protein